MLCSVAAVATTATSAGNINKGYGQVQTSRVVEVVMYVTAVPNATWSKMAKNRGGMRGQACSHLALPGSGHSSPGRHPQHLGAYSSQSGQECSSLYDGASQTPPRAQQPPSSPAAHGFHGETHLQLAPAAPALRGLRGRMRGRRLPWLSSADEESEMGGQPACCWIETL
jgi:hypothetical protein